MFDKTFVNNMFLLKNTVDGHGFLYDLSEKECEIFSTYK